MAKDHASRQDLHKIIDTAAERDDSLIVAHIDKDGMLEWAIRFFMLNDHDA